MSLDQLIERLYTALLYGDRSRARAVVEECTRSGYSPEDTVSDVFWTVHERVETEFREDRLTRLEHKLATRLLRALADQASARFGFAPPNGRRVFAVSGPSEADELAGQMATDLLEGSGFEIAFAGGGIATDEVLARVQGDHPDVLLLFGSGPGDLPMIREVIDTVEEIGACDAVQIVVGGGVFNRAPGLAEEIGADLWAEHPLDLVDVMLDEPDRKATPDQRTVGAKAPQPAKPRRRKAA